MNICFPFDERRRDAIQRNRTIGGDGNEPVKDASAHGFNISKRLRGAGNGSPDVGGANNPGGQTRWRLRDKAIECEPAGSRRSKRCRVGRNHLKKHRIAQAQQKIVRCHARVLATDLRRNAKRLDHKGGACLKREGGNDDVIDERRRHPMPASDGDLEHTRAVQSGISSESSSTFHVRIVGGLARSLRHIQENLRLLMTRDVPR